MSKLITKIEELVKKETPALANSEEVECCNCGEDLSLESYDWYDTGYQDALSDIKQTLPQILSLIASEIKKKLPDERKTAEFGDYIAETYDEKMLVREVLLDVINLLK